MLNPDFTPLTIGIEKWKKKKKRKEKEWKERNFARLKYKNYYLNRRALLTADEILSVCMRATSTRTNSRILLPFFIQKNSVISIEGG